VLVTPISVDVGGGVATNEEVVPVLKYQWGNDCADPSNLELDTSCRSMVKLYSRGYRLQ
jgi:hypothetical protein